MASLEQSTQGGTARTDDRRLVGRTTIELHRGPDGGWLATQPDVGVAGTGPTAADAAAAFCRRIAARAD